MFSFHGSSDQELPHIEGCTGIVSTIPDYSSWVFQSLHGPFLICPLQHTRGCPKQNLSLYESMFAIHQSCKSFLMLTMLCSEERISNGLHFIGNALVFQFHWEKKMGRRNADFFRVKLRLDALSYLTASLQSCIETGFF